MKPLKMKTLVGKHFPDSVVKLSSSQFPPELPPVPPPVKEKSKLIKFLNFVSPFVILVVFILVSSAIYYSVEHDCAISYRCPDVDMQIIKKFEGNFTIELSSDEQHEIKRNHSYAIPTTNYWEAIHFVSISVTTIGYGDIVPCSWQGQLASIIICIIGIPITLMALSRLGQTYGILLHKLWSFFYQKMRKPPYKIRREAQLANKHYVPLTVGMLVTITWILCCSLYFYLTLGPEYRNSRQGFTFINSFYFTMITFLTIGYGEYSPVKYDLIFSNLVVVLNGLSLVAMCIRLFKTEIEDVVNDLIDMIDKEYTELVDNDEKYMQENKKVAVKSLIDEKQKNSGLLTKVFVASMGGGEQKKLQKLYEEKAKFISACISATPDIGDLQIQYPEVNGFSWKSYPIYVENSCQVELDEDNSYEKYLAFLSRNETAESELVDEVVLL